MTLIKHGVDPAEDGRKSEHQIAYDLLIELLTCVIFLPRPEYRLITFTCIDISLAFRYNGTYHGNTHGLPSVPLLTRLSRINTQKELLTSEHNVRRIVEIGPANVLASMARKSATALVAEQDMARSVTREILNVNHPDDIRKIYYEYDEDKTSAATEKAAPSPSATLDPAAVVVPAPAAVVVAEIPSVGVAPVLPSAPGASVDKDLSPTDILITLVAEKLRRAFDEVPISESIQGLSGGEYHPTLAPCVLVHR